MICTLNVITFYMQFFRHFNLILTEGSSVLSPTFKAKTVNKDGVVHDFNVNTNDLYTGHLAGLF